MATILSLLANLIFALLCYRNYQIFRDEITRTAPALWEFWAKGLRPYVFIGSFLALGMAASVILLLWQFLRQRTAASQAMESSQRRYRLLAELAPLVGIVRLDLVNGKWLDANHTALRLLGAVRARFVDTDIWTYAHSEDHQSILDGLRSLSAENPTVTFCCRLLFQNQEYRESEWSLSYLEQEDDETALAVFMDITEKKKAEQIKLEQEKLCGVLEMAGAAAHEFNQPLQALTGLFWLLRNKKATQEVQRGILEKMEGEVNKLAEIGKKVAQISRYAVKPYAGDIHIIDIERASENDEEME